jgi:2-methylisocitrate lyase-like PEP mutase family enzyme
VANIYGATLRKRVEARNGLLVPGAANALSARVIEELGFEAVYLSGAVHGMKAALQHLKEGGMLEEDSGLVATFAERQKLVQKPLFDDLEKRYS